MISFSDTELDNPFEGSIEQYYTRTKGHLIAHGIRGRVQRGGIFRQILQNHLHFFIGEGGANWMDTYGDMVTLLLCFFVLLYSMSTIDQERKRKHNCHPL